MDMLHGGYAGGEAGRNGGVDAGGCTDGSNRLILYHPDSISSVI